MPILSSGTDSVFNPSPDVWRFFSFLTDNVPNESWNVTRKQSGQLSERDKSMVFKEKWILWKSMMINFIGNTKSIV